MYKTRQEIFNLAYLGSKAQGFRRSIDGASCSYRGNSGRKCQIGHCIADEDYSDSLEGAGAHNEHVLAAANIGTADMGFARQLQTRHDESDDAAKMKAKLLEFAALYGLTVPDARSTEVAA